jgi:hypothetical protein
MRSLAVEAIELVRQLPLHPFDRVGTSGCLQDNRGGCHADREAGTRSFRLAAGHRASAAQPRGSVTEALRTARARGSVGTNLEARIPVVQEVVDIRVQIAVAVVARRNPRRIGGGSLERGVEAVQEVVDVRVAIGLDVTRAGIAVAVGMRPAMAAIGNPTTNAKNIAVSTLIFISGLLLGLRVLPNRLGNRTGRRC